MPGDPKRETSELLAAYVDGVGELAVEERRRVERYLASDPGARAEQAATRDMLDQLRELPPDPTDQPDWAAMEAAIHAEVGDAVPKRSFWHRYRFVLPAFGLAVAAAIVVLVIRTRSTDDEAMPVAFVPRTAVEQPVFAQADDKVTVYLDGMDLEIEMAAAADDELDELPLFGDDDIPGEEASLGFLESSDLAWLDDLDDDALERAERSLQKLANRKGS